MLVTGILCLFTGVNGMVGASAEATVRLPEQRDSANVTAQPSDLNTGVPASTVLRVHYGNLTITRPDSVIDAVDIRGYVIVKAPRVTIRRSVIRGDAKRPERSTGLLSIVNRAAKGYLIEDVTLRPQVSSYNLDGVKVRRAGTFRRVNISGTVDGMVVYGSGVKVSQSYLHDFAHFDHDPSRGGRPSHDDAIQVQAGKNISIRGNTLEGAYNAAVQVTQDIGTTRNLAINNNWIAGGGCSLNYKSNGAKKKGMQAIGNRFGRGQRVADCAIIHNTRRSDLRPKWNVWGDTGAPATARRGS